MPSIGRLFATLRADSTEFANDLRKASGILRRESRAITDIGDTLTKGVTLPLAAAGAAIFKFGTDFEEGFAGVRKTVNASEADLAKLEQGFRDLSKEIPISVVELTRIGEAAGQLGIQTENILSFTDTIAKIGVATNLSSEEAAVAFAQIANVTGLAQTEFEQLGNVLVDLGNNFATNEQQIVEYGKRISAAGKIAGLNAHEILALGTAFASAGNQAEAGGTAIQKVLIGLTDAVASGGKELQLFAAVAGQSAESFRQSFQTDAAGAITAFIEGLKRVSDSGGNVFEVLRALELQDQRVIRALLSTANAGDLTRRAFEQQNTALENNNALQNEASKRFETTKSQLILLANSLTDVGVELFKSIEEPLKKDIFPALKSLADGIATAIKWFSALPQPVKTGTFAILALTATIGPLLSSIGRVGTGVATLQGAFATLLKLEVASKLATWAKGFLSVESAALTTKLGILALIPVVTAYNASIAGDDIRRYTAENVRLNELLGEQRGLWQAVVEGLFPIPRMIAEATRVVSLATEAWSIWKEQGIKGVLFELNRLTPTEEQATEHMKKLGEQAAEHLKQFGILAGETENVTVATNEWSSANLEAALAAAETESKTKSLKDAVKALVDDFKATIAPADALLQKMYALQQAGIDGAEVFKVYGAQLLAAIEAQNAFEGIEPPKSIIGDLVGEDSLGTFEADAKKAAQATVDLTETLPPLSKAQQELDRMTNILAKDMPALLREIEQLQAQGLTAAQISELLGSRVRTVAEAAKLFGQALPEPIRQLVKMQEQAKRTATLAGQLRDAWSHAVGEISARFARGVGDMLLNGQKFALDLKSIFKNLANSIVQIMLNNLFLKLAGLFTGFLSNIPILGGLFGGLGGSALAGGTGAGAAGAAGAAAGGGGGFLASLGGLLTNPITLAIGGIAGAVFGLSKLFDKNPFESGIKEIARDFGGIQIPQDALKQFLGGVGLDKEGFEPIRKDVLSSPAFFKDVLLPAAQAQGKVDELIRAFSNLQAFGSGHDFSQAIREATEGSFSKFNEQFKSTFSQSVGPLIDTLTVASTATEQLSDATAAGAGSAEELATTLREDARTRTDFLIVTLQNAQYTLTNVTDRIEAKLDSALTRLEEILTETLSSAVTQAAQTMPTVEISMDGQRVMTAMAPHMMTELETGRTGLRESLVRTNEQTRRGLF